MGAADGFVPIWCQAISNHHKPAGCPWISRVSKIMEGLILERDLEHVITSLIHDYRKIASIIRTESQNLNVSCLVFQSSLPNPLKPGVKDRAHLSTFKIFIFEKCSCFIVLVVFLVIVQSSELILV